MNRRKFKSDINQLKTEGLRLVSLSDDAKFIWRVTIANLMLNGLSTSVLAPSCGESDGTVFLQVHFPIFVVGIPYNQCCIFMH